jgi:hypothetical protein
VVAEDRNPDGEREQGRYENAQKAIADVFIPKPAY